MKNLFPGYYKPSNSDLEVLWGNCLFVFDTNVLLNLYSYPNSAREIFLSVLHKVADRSWIPYQVALEFHRNRFNRIKQSNKAVHELREKVRTISAQIEKDFNDIEFEKRDTGINDITSRLNAVKESCGLLEEALNIACERLPTIELDDPIGQQVNDIFKDRIGNPPIDQAALDELVKDGAERFEQKVPPGFSDNSKGDTYRDRGQVYQGKFGDLILWRQFMDYVEKNEKRHVIFITGDRKPDWWMQESGRVLGPLPELVQEFRTKTGADIFWMYSADQFLKYALQFLEAEEVTPETIAQVKETTDYQKFDLNIGNVSALNTDHDFYDDYLLHKNSIVEKKNKISRQLWSDSIDLLDEGTKDYIKYDMGDSNDFHHLRNGWELNGAIENWLQRMHPGKRIIETSSYPNYVVESQSEMRGYEILKLNASSKKKIIDEIKKSHIFISENKLKDISILVVFPLDSRFLCDESYQNRFIGEILDMSYEYIVSSLIFGYVENKRFHEVARLTAPRSSK